MIRKHFLLAALSYNVQKIRRAIFWVFTRSNSIALRFITKTSSNTEHNACTMFANWMMIFMKSINQFESIFFSTSSTFFKTFRMSEAQLEISQTILRRRWRYLSKTADSDCNLNWDLDLWRLLQILELETIKKLVWSKIHPLKKTQKFGKRFASFPLLANDLLPSNLCHHFHPPQKYVESTLIYHFHLADSQLYLF